MCQDCNRWIRIPCNAGLLSWLQNGPCCLEGTVGIGSAAKQAEKVNFQMAPRLDFPRQPGGTDHERFRTDIGVGTHDGSGARAWRAARDSWMRDARCDRRFGAVAQRQPGRPAGRGDVRAASANPRCRPVVLDGATVSQVESVAAASSR